MCTLESSVPFRDFVEQRDNVDVQRTINLCATEDCKDAAWEENVS